MSEPYQDRWQSDDGSVVLYLGDCLDILPTLEPGSVDAVVTDLPYGTTSNKWDAVIPFNQLWPRVKPAMKENAVFITTASQPFSSALVMSNPEWFRHEWVWIKNRGSNFANTVREPFKEHESVLVFSRGRWTYNPQMQDRTGAGLDRVKYEFGFRSHSTNYREFPERAGQVLPDERVPSSWQKFNTEVGLHPTQKPLPLFQYLVATYSNEGDLVADIAMGSATTGMACIRRGRRFLGIEKYPEHFETGRKRIEAEINRMPLFAEQERQTQAELWSETWKESP